MFVASAFKYCRLIHVRGVRIKILRTRILLRILIRIRKRGIAAIHNESFLFLKRGHICPRTVYFNTFDRDTLDDVNSEYKRYVFML